MDSSYTQCLPLSSPQKSKLKCAYSYYIGPIGRRDQIKRAVHLLSKRVLPLNGLFIQVNFIPNKHTRCGRAVRPEFIVPIIYILISNFTRSVKNEECGVSFEKVCRMDIIEHFLTGCVPNINRNFCSVFEFVGVLVNNQSMRGIGDLLTKLITPTNYSSKIVRGSFVK